MEKKIVRIQLDVSEEKANEMDKIIEQSGVKSRRELFNLALSLLKWAIDQKKEGRIIASVDEKNDKYKELMLPV